MFRTDPRLNFSSDTKSSYIICFLIKIDNDCYGKTDLQHFLQWLSVGWQRPKQNRHILPIILEKLTSKKVFTSLMRQRHLWRLSASAPGGNLPLPLATPLMFCSPFGIYATNQTKQTTSELLAPILGCNFSFIFNMYTVTQN